MVSMKYAAMFLLMLKQSFVFFLSPIGLCGRPLSALIARRKMS